MQVDIRRILFPTDFSEPARQAQKYAMALAERFDAELQVLHVIAPMPIASPDMNMAWVPTPEDVAYQTEAARQRLNDEMGTEWLNAHANQLSVKVGFAVDEIIAHARANNVDMIVVGTHGHTGLSHLLLGSVAEKVVRLAECPVMTVHPKGHQFVIDGATRAVNK